MEYLGDTLRVEVISDGWMRPYNHPTTVKDRSSINTHTTERGVMKSRI